MIAILRKTLLVSAIAALAASHAYAQAPDDLPPYKPEQKVSGVIRNFGIKMEGMVKLWEEGFRKYHPDVRFEDNLNNASAVAGLFSGVADVGTSGREPVLTEYFSFYETFHYLPLEITVASATYDVKGGSYGL